MKKRTQVRRKCLPYPKGIVMPPVKFPGPADEFPGPDAENDVDILQRLTNELIADPTRERVHALSQQVSKTQNRSTCDAPPLPAAWACAHEICSQTHLMLRARERWAREHYDTNNIMASGKYADE